MVINGTINSSRFKSIKRLFCLYKISKIRSIIVTENDNPVSCEKLKTFIMSDLKQLWRDFSYPDLALETGRTRLKLNMLYDELNKAVNRESYGSVTKAMIYDYPKKGAFFQNYVVDDETQCDSPDVVRNDIGRLSELTRKLFSILIAYAEEPEVVEITFEKAIRYVNILELIDATFCILSEGDGVFVENDMGV